MDQVISSETSSVVQEVNRAISKITDRINRKHDQLNATGMTSKDRENLKKRLNFTWVGPHSNKDPVTAWRQNTAQRILLEIQDADHHLFLSFILAITPTECSKSNFKKAKDSLVSLKTHEGYRLDLDPEEKVFFESTAVANGLAGNRRYLDFMTSLFPREEQRLYQLAYSAIPLDEIESFFNMLREGIKSSKLWKEERGRRQQTSSFVTALIPTGDKDICFTVTVGRKDGMEALGECKLAQIKLQ